MRALILLFLALAAGQAAADWPLEKRSQYAVPWHFNPFIKRQSSCSSGDTDCGNLCVPSGYKCCSDGGAGCPIGQNCVPGGCCPVGKSCSGGGGTFTVPESSSSTGSSSSSSSDDDDDDDNVSSPGDDISSFPTPTAFSGDDASASASFSDILASATRDLGSITSLTGLPTATAGGSSGGGSGSSSGGDGGSGGGDNLNGGGGGSAGTGTRRSGSILAVAMGIVGTAWFINNI